MIAYAPSARRSRGEGGLHFDESRQRWIATAALGYDARGKRITRKASGTTKTAAKAKLREMLRDHAEGLTVASGADTVDDTVRDWLAYGLAGRSAATVANYTTIAEVRIIAPLGRRRLRDLSAEDVDRWLRAQATQVSTRTLRLMHSILNRAIVRAMARDKVQRNVVGLCTAPTGQAGRPSKSLTLAQADALLTAAQDFTTTRLRRALPTDRGAHRGSPRAALGTRRPRRQPAQHSPGPAVDLRAALGPGRRRHQDPQVATPHRHPPPLRRRPHRTPRQPRAGTRR